MSDKIIQLNEGIINEELKAQFRNSVGLQYMCYTRREK